MPRTVAAQRASERGDRARCGPPLTRLLGAVLLVVRIACQRLDLNWGVCLQMRLSRPVIEVVLEHPAAEREALLRRVNEIYPF